MGRISQEIDTIANMEEDLLTTILDLYRQDIAELKVGNSFDTDLDAVEIYLDEIEQALMIEKDKRSARSIVDAALSDIPAITAIRQAEDQCAQDRNLAQGLAEVPDEIAARNAGRNQAQPPPPYYEAINPTSHVLSMLAGFWVSEEAGRALHPNNLEGCANTAPGFDETVVRKIECTYCGDDKSYFEVIEVQCGHPYCKPCLQDRFQLAFDDESLFPPRCCTEPIKIADVAIFLTKELIETFGEKEIEYNTAKRTYCAKKSCTKFIVPSAISNSIAYCQNCGVDTCELCKNVAHIGHPCPEDANLKVVLDLARAEKWQRCGKCKAMVELGIGCNHITCRCGNQFCYVCGKAPWKSCKCAQWDEERLFDRARVLAARDRQDVEEVRTNLINRHNCRHPYWESCEGGRCEECNYNAPEFLYRCDRCAVRFCRNCRDYRRRYM